MDLDSKKVQVEIDDLDYWDSRVTKLECNYFADEVILKFDNVICEFKDCYEVLFNHVKNYDKLRPTKEMTIAQIPYFIQKFSVCTEVIDEIDFYKFQISMFPMTVLIICRKIVFLKEDSLK